MTKQAANFPIPQTPATTMSSEGLSAPLTRKRGITVPLTAAEGQYPTETDGQEPQCPDTLFNQHLYWWDQVPKQLQFNRYIRSGYRAGLSPAQCMCSIFQYHNETGNIWVHLLPLLLLGTLLLRGSLPPWPLARIAFLETVAPILICLSGSVLYHTFMANHWHYQKYLFIDVCGVFLVLVSGAGAGMYWGLQCYPWLCGSFIAAYILAAALCVVLGVKAKTQRGRAAPMVGLLVVRGSAVLMRIILSTGSASAAYCYLAMEVTAVAGALVNVARVPEKWLFAKTGPADRCRKPGKYDYWLNSHQLMHLLVLCSLVFKYQGMAEDYKYRVELRTGC